MKPSLNIQIPNIIVYVALYAVVFAISIWLLVFHAENPTNWILYIGVAWSVLAGLIKLAWHSRKRLQPSSK